MNNIIFLGTAGDLDVVKSGRSSGGVAINVDDHQILIDPGIGTLLVSAQCKIDVSKTDIMLVSSSNIVDSNEINALASLAQDVKIICQNNGREYCLLEKTKSRIIHAEKEVYNIRGIEIQRLITKDGNASFKITTPKYVLGYIADTSLLKKSFQEFKDTNILVIKCSGEFDKNNIFKLIEDIEPELVILTGYGKAIIKEDPLEFSRILKKSLQENNKDKKDSTKIQIIPAKDGMVVNPESYNIRLKQKSLKGFV